MQREKDASRNAKVMIITRYDPPRSFAGSWTANDVTIR